VISNWIEYGGRAVSFKMRMGFFMTSYPTIAPPENFGQSQIEARMQAGWPA